MKQGITKVVILLKEGLLNLSTMSTFIISNMLLTGKNN